MSGIPQQHLDQDIDEDSDSSDAGSQEGDNDSAIETNALNCDADSSSDAGESEFSSVADLDPELQEIKGFASETLISFYPLIFARRYKIPAPLRSRFPYFVPLMKVPSCQIQKSKKLKNSMETLKKQGKEDMDNSTLLVVTTK
jgi:hypothetical protein